MNLIQESQKANKNAYKELVEKYNYIFYKFARIYFISDNDVYQVLQKVLTRVYSEIINCKTEHEFICFTLKYLLVDCQKLAELNKKDVDKKIESKTITVDITNRVGSSSTNLDNIDYQNYRKASLVEEYLTSIEPQYRALAYFYYYANLTVKEISVIMKKSESSLNADLDKIRIKIYEMIKNKEVDL